MGDEVGSKTSALTSDSIFSIELDDESRLSACFRNHPVLTDTIQYPSDYTTDSKPANHPLNFPSIILMT